MIKYNRKVFSSKEKDEDEKKDSSSIKKAGGAAVGAIGVSVLGKKLAGKLEDSAINKIAGMQVTDKDYYKLLREIKPSDVFISRGRCSNYNEVGPFARSMKHVPEETKKRIFEDAGTKEIKVLAEIGPHNLPPIAAHELGHSEYMAGRGSLGKIGRIAHDLYAKSRHAGKIASIAGLAGGGLTDEDSKKQRRIAIAGAGGIGLLASSPEIFAEYCANREGLKILKEKGKVKSEYLDKVKKAYRPQLGARIAGRAIPAAAIGAGAAGTTIYLKKYLKERSNKDK